KGYVKKEQGFTDFIPQEYINFISETFQKDSLDISKAFFDEKNFENVLFTDVMKALNSLSGIYDLGIFSESFKEFQLLKLHRTNVLNYFNPDLIFIYSRKLTQEALDSLPDNCFIIDDNPEVISGLIESGRFKPIWLNRKTQEEHEKCVTIFDLKNLKEILENYSIK
ncbi:hypothetical protein K0B04_02800, partial [Patescibacteria group bacterium]|nr:hypothetical protein [Patescibacteria group bacterium]